MARRVERIMGTVFSLDVRGEVDEAVLDRAFDIIRAADARFSPYLATSELSRVVRGELAESESSPQFRHVLALADDLCRTSDGYFDARHHRADGRLDPSGLVKGWAAEAATRVLDGADVTAYCLNAGGDVLARGVPRPGDAWRVGIRHPAEPGQIVAVLAVRDMAVATSGAYERGAHIRDPHTHEDPGPWWSMTVVGPSLTYADAYATAAYAMGRPGLAWVAGHPGYGAYAVDHERIATWTPVVDGFLDRREAGR
jgi:thiamine biosynthesis lipoprotein